MERAEKEHSLLLSKNEPMSTRKPFVFRAHEPLKSNTRGFQ